MCDGGLEGSESCDGFPAVTWRSSLPCGSAGRPAASTSSIDLLWGGWDGGSPQAARVSNAAVAFLLGTCSSFCGSEGFVASPGRAAPGPEEGLAGAGGKGGPVGCCAPSSMSRQPCRARYPLLRARFPLRRAVFSLSGRDAGRWARSVHWAGTPQVVRAWPCRAAPGCLWKRSAFFYFILLY